MAKASTERLIQTGFEHLGRFAFYTRDNPFITQQASLVLESTHPEELARLLDGEIEVEDWLQGKLAKKLLADINLGSVPRDAQLPFFDGEPVVGVDSVHAFLHAQLFWWLVSILWCVLVAKPVDEALDDGVLGFRFEQAFLDDPARGGLMLSDQRFALQKWKDFPQEVREKHPGKYLTTAELDLRAFYYSVDVGPDQILRRFFGVDGKRPPRTRRVRVLTALLEALHRRYSGICAEVDPRGQDLEREGESPLPVGLPSSQVLANMIISILVGEVESLPGTVAVAAYADDLIVISETLPELRESPAAYFSRIGLIKGEIPYPLACETTRTLGRFSTSDDKMAVSYGRHLESESPEEAAARRRFRERLGLAEDDQDDYEDHDNADWGGHLTTVLRTAHKRERVPRKLRSKVFRLLEEVRIGLAPEETARLFDELFEEELDRRLFVALRPYWRELIVIGIAARGMTAVKDLTEALRQILETITLPDGAKPRAYRALRFGLRQSWYQALAQAIAVATDEEDREELLHLMPRIDLGLRKERSRRTRGVISYSRRIRARRLIPDSLVSVPLAEFSAWEGALIGPGAFRDFLAWNRREKPPGADPEALAGEVGEALRFVNLHEACLAVHLWAGRDPANWVKEAFGILEAQPLIDERLVDELRTSAAAILEPGSPAYGGPDEDQRLIRIGLPSMKVEREQLKAAVDADSARLSAIAARSRRALRRVVSAAIGDHVDLLVLPEWAVLPELVPWLMEQSSRRRMLVVGGEAPVIAGGEYWNCVWTGIPVTDSAGHRACLVPPPRQKHFLSPEEEKILDESEAGYVKAPSSHDDLELFSWRGVRFASLVCFEFADLEFRRRVRFDVDLITVSSLNRDWRYFDVIQDSVTRDNYCLTVCVNTGTFPGTRITRPTKSEMAVSASVHGSDDPALITKRVDMWPIVAAQIKRVRPLEAINGYDPRDGVRLCDYKPFPPV